MRFFLGLVLFALLCSTQARASEAVYGGFFCSAKESSEAIANAWKQNDEAGAATAEAQQGCFKAVAKGRNNLTLRHWTRDHDSIGLFQVELELDGKWTTVFYLKPVIIA